MRAKLGKMPALLLALGLLLPTPVAAELVTPQMQAHVHQGVDAVYRMQFDIAEKEFSQLRTLNPEHPYGHFGLALVIWMRYTYGSEGTDQSLVPAFNKQVKKTVKIGEAWVKLHPKDAEGWMALGAIRGLRARLLLADRHYIKAYLTGRNAMKSVRKAVKMDPDLVDAKLGVAMYDYYTDLYPHFVGVLAKIVLRGNRKRGIELLKLIAEKGNYTRTAGKMLLIEIYNQDPFGDRNPPEAVRLIKEVRTLYPKSAMLHSAELVSLFHAGRYDDVFPSVKEYLDRTRDGTYRPMEAAKGYVILGTTHLAKGELEVALRSYHQASRIMLAGRICRWAVWGMIRTGHAQDLLGQRNLALSSYKEAAKQPDLWGYKKIAKRQLKRPFKKKEPLELGPPRH
jgi:hypothetical protein